MTVLATDRRQPATIVTCSECGHRFELSVRNVQRHRSEGREPRCRDCRRSVSRPKPTEQDREWWLERFSADECAAMGRAIFG